MKTQYIKYVLLVMVLVLSACNKDYLDTEPTQDISSKLVFKDTESVEFAVNGLAKIMTTAYIDFGYNGEGTIKLYYGDYPGSNFRKDLLQSISLINNENLENTDSRDNSYPWHYYYILISNANEIIAKVDGVEGPLNKKRYLKGQALAFRSYAYIMLIQIYGNRWQDSNNGETSSVVLRLSPNDPKELPLAKLGDVYKQIYSDLDLSLQLFKESGYNRGEAGNYVVDSDVVHAMYARAALNKQDYNVALREARLAKQNYPLMSIDAYKKGFATPTSEWIWSSYGSLEEKLDSYSFGGEMGYNANTVNEVVLTFVK